MEPATDLAMLVGKGYSEKQAREALQRAQGDVRQAALILRDGNSRDTSWLNKTNGEWVDNVPTTSLPANAESRALWKSPVYVRIGSWTKNQENGAAAEKVLYILTVILRDARQWTLRRSFSQFYAFWSALPYAVTSSLKNSFPHSSIFHFLSLSNEKLEERRLRLEEWLRELCFNEQCMTNDKVIGPLYRFLDEENHRIAEVAITPVKSPFIPESTVPPKRSYLQHRTLISFPMTLPKLTKHLPCKIGLYTVFATNRELVTSGNNSSSKDASDAQLDRDISRDRVVINGKRLLGSSGGLASILAAAVETAAQVQQSGGMTPSPRPQLETLCKAALRHAARTESAFLCHTALTMLLDTTTHPDMLIVPESSLADALCLHFSLSHDTPRLLPGSDSIVVPSKLVSSKGPGSRLLPRLACDITAATVYRVTDDRTMETLLQVKVTYCMPLTEAHYPMVSESSIRSPPDPYEEVFLVLEKETSTTTRDWKGDQTLL